MEEITIRHLLSHSSGFRGSTWPWGGGEAWHPHEPTRWEQLVAMMPYTEILFPPGSRYAYSNPGIVFLGQVIERLSGEEWEVYVEKNILRPLGMHRILLRLHALSSSSLPFQQLLRHRWCPDRKRSGFRHRDHGFQRRPERPSGRHGPVPGVPDGFRLGGGEGGLRGGVGQGVPGGDVGGGSPDPGSRRSKGSDGALFLRRGIRRRRPT